MNFTFTARLFKHTSWVLLALFIMGCMPVIQRFYQAPQVSGRVLDLTSLEPLAGVKITHRGYLEPALITDVGGSFVLSSVSQIKATVLMPGHAIKDYPIILTTATSNTLLMAKATMLMRTEELVTIGDIVIDSQPKIIAPSPKPNYNEHQQLLDFVDTNSRSGNCDKALGIMAVDNLNAARKLYWRLQQSANSKKLQAYTQGSYSDAHAVWRFWESSCDWSALSAIQRRDAIIDLRKVIADITSEADK